MIKIIKNIINHVKYINHIVLSYLIYMYSKNSLIIEYQFWRLEI
jgi:hypothetical protein